MADTRYAYRWVEGRSYFTPAGHYGPGAYEHERDTLEEVVELVASWPEKDPDPNKPQRLGKTHIEHRMVVRERPGDGVDGLVEKPVARFELDGSPLYRGAAPVLTDAQKQTLYDVRDGQVTRSKGWQVHGARSDVLGRLEEKHGLVRADWDAEPRGRVMPQYPVVLTLAGEKAIERSRR